MTTSNRNTQSIERTLSPTRSVRSAFSHEQCSGYVYLLHFHPRYKHARHYLGYAKNVSARFQEHQRGTGARLTQVAIASGAQLELVRVWKGNRKIERMLKRRKNAPLLCPLCNPHALRRAVDIDDAN